MTDRPTLYRLTIQPSSPADTEDEMLAYEVLDAGVLVPVEPAGTAEVYTINVTKNIEFDNVEDGSYWLIAVEADDDVR